LLRSFRFLHDLLGRLWRWGWWWWGWGGRGRRWWWRRREHGSGWSGEGIQGAGIYRRAVERGRLWLRGARRDLRNSSDNPVRHGNHPTQLKRTMVYRRHSERGFSYMMQMNGPSAHNAGASPTPDPPILSMVDGYDGRRPPSCPVVTQSGYARVLDGDPASRSQHAGCLALCDA
jgi:hypothetical protein